MTENVAFGSGSEKRTFPSFVHPDRLGNENLLPVLYQDPEMGPGLDCLVAGVVEHVVTPALLLK